MKALDFYLIYFTHIYSLAARRKLRYSKCSTGQCPPWKCQDDSAVIHGYCCHCPGWQYGKERSAGLEYYILIKLFILHFM